MLATTWLDTCSPLRMVLLEGELLGRAGARRRLFALQPS
eukprot:CAMPEP_0185555220 /NCGR_PEP_ID=MMETSP1381-20130426/43761_1 /TAXON_ID=298111 /ORGANISM="Pavlova sp., Strain CCMP459" /LENGTH=38 /DNA_ID= /DNA_START= /DNA_END= /DNA_ORIENTATION=